ncbi:VOC family protein [Exilibacterium tricleocarpae]|uniref:VOC family protein n=1 Tax=Exilibacterium tricleocarpae TaxID=2591008 RepID=A0A545TNF2_9GAMM|nr:VOC family protein [Exilibacterium tricleocarpae]TQV78753.1 VOC family protein [Exilibacterium tricleocarpae]
MEQRLSVITLGVADLGRARDFYDSLGWKPANDNTEEIESIVAYNLIGFSLALFPLDKLAEDTTVTMTKGMHPSFTLAYTVQTPGEVDQTLQQVEAAGGTIIKPGQKVFWGGYSGYFSDLDGYLWEVAHNPFASHGEDGSFRW